MRGLANPSSFSPLCGYHYLIIDLTAGHLSPGLHTKVALTQIPCPTIAITGSRERLDPDLLNSFDVLVESEADTRSLIKNIDKCPLTAMTLVQLLRHNEQSSLEDGLLAESLAYASLQGGKEFKEYLLKRTPPEQAPSNTSPAVLVTRIANTLTLTLNRPEQRNAYSAAMRDALYEGLVLLGNDSSIDKAIITGAGSCFSTGGALNEFGLVKDTATAHAIRTSRQVGKLISEQADRIECHLHRACIGAGIELPAFARRVEATADSYFHLPEISMGLIPGAGGTVSILNRIGRQRTAYWALSARRIKAKTALEWGLIDAII